MTSFMELMSSYYDVLSSVKWRGGQISPVVISVHGKKKYAAGHMDRLLRKAAGPQQRLPVHTLDQVLSFTEIPGIT